MIDLPAPAIEVLFSHLDLVNLMSLYRVSTRFPNEMNSNTNQKLVIQRIVERIFEDPSVIESARVLLRPDYFSALTHAFMMHRFIILVDCSRSIESCLYDLETLIQQTVRPLFEYKTSSTQEIAIIQTFPYQEQQLSVSNDFDLELLSQHLEIRQGSNFVPSLSNATKHIKDSGMSFSIYMISDFEFDRRHMNRFNKIKPDSLFPLYSFKCIEVKEKRSISMIDPIKNRFSELQTTALHTLEQNLIHSSEKRNHSLLPEPSSKRIKDNPSEF